MDSPNEKKHDDDSVSETPSVIAASWNTAQEALLKGISERSNCMRWLHTQSQIYFDNMNFYLTIPNVIITTVNGSITMSLNSLFTEPLSQKYALTIIGLISIFSAILTTINQYVKSAQMSEAHRTSAIAYGKLHRVIMNELALRRDQRPNSMEFLKTVRNEQDRLENSSPTILEKIINKFNIQFVNQKIEKPEITGDLDEVNINRSPYGSMLTRAYTFVKTPVLKASSLMGISNKISPNDGSPIEDSIISIQRTPVQPKN
jgi:hypothetical protein